MKIKHPRTVRPESSDCPPNTWKLIFLKVFNKTLILREIATHLNAMHANFDPSGTMESQANEIDPSW
jgi:hypothetical protein